MKYLITLIIVATSFAGYSQNDLSRITAKTKKITLPFGSDNDRMRKWVNSKPVELDSNDRLYLINSLKKTTQLIINPKGGTGFGDLDYRDSWSFLDDVKHTALVGIIKSHNSSGFILYLKVELDEIYAEWHGILISCDNHGKIINWMYADGDAN